MSPQDLREYFNKFASIDNIAGDTLRKLRVQLYSTTGAITSTTGALNVNISSGLAAMTNDGTFATPTLQGSLTETAPASDTASSGLNGRLQRIAQRLTTIISGLFVTGFDIDNAVQSANTKPVIIGGKAVTTASYAPAYTAGDAVQAAYDKDNGALLVNQGALSSLTDNISSIYGESITTSYSVGTSNLAVAATATDIFEISGSASKVVRIKKITVSGVATANGTYTIRLVKRSTANTVGTSSTLTIVPHDSSDAAATAIVKSYTANPTTGTTVGIIKNKKMTVSTAATSTVDANVILFEFGQYGEKSIVLRGTSEMLTVNLSNTTITGGTLDIDITWTESSS